MIILNKFKKYALILYLIFAVIVLSRAFAHKKEQNAYKDSQGSTKLYKSKNFKKMATIMHVLVTPSF